LFCIPNVDSLGANDPIIMEPDVERIAQAISQLG